jgi:hypothetical protein
MIAMSVVLSQRSVLSLSIARDATKYTNSGIVKAIALIKGAAGAEPN